MVTKENILNTVTLVNADNGLIRNTGTAFFVKYLDNNNVENYMLVSNRHIFYGNKNFEFSIPVIDKKTNCHILITCSMKIEPYCDTQYDIAAIGINDVFKSFDPNKYCHNIIFIGKEDMLDNEMIEKSSTIESVLMLGYPHALIGDSQLCPIVKSGITATPLTRNYNGKKDFLTDILSYEGSSGSPIFVSRDSCYYLCGIHHSRISDKNDISVGLGINTKSNVIIETLKL